MRKILSLTIILIISFCSYGQFKLDSLKIKDSLVYKFVVDWYGVKYKIGGDTKQGIDCSGLTLKLYENIFNVRIPRTAKDQYKSSKRIKKDSLTIGDLVFFRPKKNGRWHVGIYLIDNYFIHSSNHKTGVKINNLSDPYYMKNYIGGGRIY